MNKIDFDAYVTEIVAKNMLDPEVRAGIRREEKLGSAAHKTSRTGRVLENYGAVVKPATYYGGKVK